MEAVINSCPAFAVSQEYVEDVDFELAAVASAIVARNILEHGLKRGELVSVNVPAVSVEDCEGIEVTRVGRRVYQDELTERSTRAASPTTGSAARRRRGSASRARTSTPSSTGGSSVTPIHLDLTGRRLLRQLQTWDWALDEAAHEAATGPTGCGRAGRRRPRWSRRGSRGDVDRARAEPATAWTSVHARNERPSGAAGGGSRSCSHGHDRHRQPRHDRRRAPGLRPDAAADGGARPADAREERVVWLSTVAPGRHAASRPTWFWWDGEALVVFSKPGAARCATCARTRG
jgi:hypothetical protein